MRGERENVNMNKNDRLSGFSYLENDDEPEEHPNGFPWIGFCAGARIFVRDYELNVFSDIFLHPEMTANCANNAEHNQDENAPEHVNIHLLLQLRSLIARPAVVQHCFCLMTRIHDNALDKRSVLERTKFVKASGRTLMKFSIYFQAALPEEQVVGGNGNSFARVVHHRAMKAINFCCRRVNLESADELVWYEV